VIYIQCFCCFFLLWRYSANRVKAASFFKFLDFTHTHTHTHTVRLLWTRDGSVAEAATSTTHNKHKRRTSMPSAGFEPVIPATERLQTYALRPYGHRDRLACNKHKHPCSLICVKDVELIQQSDKLIYYFLWHNSPIPA
jgi:hypothetical protein